MARALLWAFLSFSAAVSHAGIISAGESESYAFDFAGEATPPPYSGYTWLFTDYIATSLRFQIDFFDGSGSFLGAWGPFSLANTSGAGITSGNVFDSPWTSLTGTATISVISGSLQFSEFGLCLDGTCGQVDQFVRGVAVPEPGSLGLLAAGLLALGFMRRKTA